MASLLFKTIRYSNRLFGSFFAGHGKVYYILSYVLLQDLEQLNLTLIGRPEFPSLDKTGGGSPQEKEKKRNSLQPSIIIIIILGQNKKEQTRLGVVIPTP